MTLRTVLVAVVSVVFCDSLLLSFIFAVTFPFAAFCVLRCSCINVVVMSLVSVTDPVVQEAWCWDGEGKSC